jgi:hypothetical protein
MPFGDKGYRVWFDKLGKLNRKLLHRNIVHPIRRIEGEI